MNDGRCWPRASAPLRNMTWNKWAEYTAHTWVKTCPTGHNPNRNGFGENLYMDSRSSVDMKAAVKMWVDEGIDPSTNSFNCN